VSETRNTHGKGARDNTLRTQVEGNVLKHSGYVTHMLVGYEGCLLKKEEGKLRKVLH